MTDSPRLLIHCKYDKLVHRSDLKPHPQNRNEHPPEQIARLAKILRYQGIRAPIVVSKHSGFIVKGHGTCEALWLCGETQAPVVVQEFESDEQEYAFVQSDNAIASWAELNLSGINSDIGELGPDFDIELLGIKDFVIEPADKFEGDEDAVPEVSEEALAKRGELYRLGKHRLLCGDSTDASDVERLLNGEQVEMLFTDPPYGLGGYGGRNNMRLTGDDLDPAIFYQILPKLPEMYVWGYFWTFPLLNFKPRDAIIWKKNNFGLGKGYRGQYEVCFYFGDFDRSDSDVWDIAKDTNYKHPTQKPVALAERAIKNSCPDSVLDLFLGSGSTLIACEKTGRKCYGIEIDPLYCDVIIERWQKFTGKEAIREDGTKWADLEKK